MPFTSTRKILVLGIAAVLAGLLIDKLEPQSKSLLIFTFLSGAAACVWVIWPVLVRQEGIGLGLMLVSSILYTGILTAFGNNQRSDQDKGSMIALALGFGTGISAILGASALIGQLGMAIGAIAGAFLLLSLFKQELQLGSNFMLPASLLSGLLGVGVVVYASLPWYCLLPLCAIPFTSYIRLPENLTKLNALLLRAAVTLPFAVIAIAITWFSTNSNESMY